MRKVRALKMRRAALLSAQGATDAQALTLPSLYPEWAAGVAYGGEGEPCIVRQPGTSQLYRINERKAHTSQAGAGVHALSMDRHPGQRDRDKRRPHPGCARDGV